MPGIALKLLSDELPVQALGAGGWRQESNKKPHRTTVVASMRSLVHRSTFTGLSSFAL